MSIVSWFTDLFNTTKTKAQIASAKGKELIADGKEVLEDGKEVVQNTKRTFNELKNMKDVTLSNVGSKAKEVYNNARDV